MDTVDTNPVKVLVTGIGGDLAQTVLKALRVGHIPISAHGCDIDPNSIGVAFVESFHTVPIASDKTYIHTVDALCRQLGVDAIIPCTEPEIQVLCRLEYSNCMPCGAAIVCQDVRFVDTFGDKLACMQMLQGHVDLASFADGRDPVAVASLVADSGYPVVVKGRHSWGSQNRTFAKNQSELTTALASTPQPMVQSFLENTDGEYSVGVFSAGKFKSTIAFKRHLGPAGNSWFAETSEDKSVHEYAMSIAKASELKGSANIQVRKTAAGVRLLEVNPRFSSLAAARAACGFRDVEWSLEMALGRQVSYPTSPYRHIRFRRFFHEVIDFGDGFQAIGEWAPNSVWQNSQR